MNTTLKQLLYAVVLITLATATAVPASATIALEAFDFTGTCTDCVGEGTGTLLLLSGYTLGSPITTDNFYAFDYSSSILNPGITIGHNSSDLIVSGSLPSTLPGTATVNISGGGYDFSSSVTGAWSVNAIEVLDYGPSSVWSVQGATSTVPEPATIGMLGVGLLAFALARIRA